ncbi:uncharacterized protein LOC133888296 [Phragmites australis]|uniref:uncharacterized protein LOC133888296 n=1 Tax=Phragmites australis TaxID=29695 RepID=UPI002D764BB2|nr:uncharacterized protein LOC133888296 [Phragmites australis]
MDISLPSPPPKQPHGTAPQPQLPAALAIFSAAPYKYLRVEGSTTAAFFGGWIGRLARYDIHNSQLCAHETRAGTRVMSLHNKPKKALSNEIVPQDYICTKNDLDIILPIKNMPSLPEKEVLVLIDDALVNRRHLECLIQPSAFLNDEVINAYICLLRAQEHLQRRSGGTVYLETTYVSTLLKRDGDNNIRMDDLYAAHDTIENSTIERRVERYLDHDMVFIPINIKGIHWYLAVIDARKSEIHVLDSMGPVYDREDLSTTLNGLQRQIDIVSQLKELKNHKWQNLRVASWPVRQIQFEKIMQTYRYISKICLPTISFH